jgi:hypothetical protein
VDPSELDSCFASVEDRYVEATEKVFYKFGCYLR